MPSLNKSKSAGGISPLGWLYPPFSVILSPPVGWGGVVIFFLGGGGLKTSCSKGAL